jgi:hypothetical protein
MSINLGIELGDDRVSAAYERSGTLRMVSAGAARSQPLQVHVGRDGAIRSGADAAAAAASDPAGLRRDLAARLADPRSVVVNGYAVTGELLLAHLLSSLVDRAEAQAPGEHVERVVLACPASWPAPAVAAVRNAAARAGLRDVELVVAAKAAERAPEAARQLPEQAAALGAAVLAAQRTRAAGAAAAGGVAPPRARPARPAAPLATDRPTSVFDGTDPAAGRPPAAAAAGLGGAGIAGGAALAGAGDGGSGPGAPAPPGAGDDGPSRVPFVAAGVVLALLLVVLAVVALTRGGDDEPASATGATGSSTTVPATTSSAAPSTTAAPTTSTSSTTTKPPTTTSSTTTTRPSSTTTTSTTIVPPSKIGPVALANDGLVLQFGSATSFTLRFGDDADGTISRVSALVGRPTSDSGWRKEDLCTGDETRRVVYDDLELVFLKNAANAPSGSRTFQQWFVKAPGKKPDGLVTLDKLGIGSTIADLRKFYGSALKVVQPIPGDPSGLFTTSEGGEFIDGITTGITDKSWILSMWAGSACQRVAD